MNPTRWPYVLAAIVIIVVALEYAPTVGGVLLGLVVLATLIHSSSGQLSEIGTVGSSSASLLA